MRIPVSPPGFAVHGSALSPVSHGDDAANSIGRGPATAAQGMAAVHDAMQGQQCDQRGVAEAAALGKRVASALEVVNAGMDMQFVCISPSAGSRAQMFGGERVCP